MLSIPVDLIANAFDKLENKITELEGRLKSINEPEKYHQERKAACHKFKQTLDKMETVVMQINQTEAVALKRNTEAMQELNKKCKHLLENVSTLLLQQDKINQSECTHSRLANSCTSKQPDDQSSIEREMELGGRKSPIRNTNNDGASGTDSDLTLSPSLRKLLKSPIEIQAGLTRNSPASSSTDLCTPPYISRRTPGGNSSKVDGFNRVATDPLLDYNAACDNTPKLENIGLSKRSFDFFKSLVSPKERKDEIENVKNHSESGGSEKSSISRLYRYFSSASKTNSSLAKAPIGTPTTPLANKNDNDDGRGAESSFILEEQDSIYADAEFDQESSDIEFKFNVNLSNKRA